MIHNQKAVALQKELIADYLSKLNKHLEGFGIKKARFYGGNPLQLEQGNYQTSGGRVLIYFDHFHESSKNLIDMDFKARVHIHTPCRSGARSHNMIKEFNLQSVGHLINEMETIIKRLYIIENIENPHERQRVLDKFCAPC